MIKLSVIIPVYNGERFIERCVNKILNEQIDDNILKSNQIELIIVSDGSTDSTEVLLLELKRNNKNNLIKLITKQNEGTSIARNVGIANAKGKYICFIDVDDFLDYNALPSLVNIIENTNCDVITFQYRNINKTKQNH